MYNKVNKAQQTKHLNARGFSYFFHNEKFTNIFSIFSFQGISL